MGDSPIETLSKAVTGWTARGRGFRGYRNLLPCLPDEVIVFQRDEGLWKERIWVHPRFVLIVPVRGKGGVILDGETIELSPFHPLLVFPFQSHHFVRTTDDGLAWFFLTFDFASEVSLSPLRKKICAPVEPWLSRFAALIRSAAASTVAKPGEAGWHLAGTLQGLLEAPERSDPPSEGRRRGPRSDLVRRVCLHLHENLDRPLATAEIAEKAAVSPTHLRRTFLASTGMNLQRFIRVQRINRASHLLARSDLSVTEIAHACGYPNLFSFSRAFRRETGRTPREARREGRPPAP